MASLSSTGKGGRKGVEKPCKGEGHGDGFTNGDEDRDGEDGDSSGGNEETTGAAQPAKPIKLIQMKRIRPRFLNIF
jgi:hypothetical protein